MGQLQVGKMPAGHYRWEDGSFQLRALLPPAGKWRMQRLPGEASRVSNTFCLFASPILLRGKRPGIYGGRSGGAHVRCDGGNSVFNGHKGSYRKRGLGFLPVNHASSPLVGD
jgi:hypothetical protein